MNNKELQLQSRQRLLDKLGREPTAAEIDAERAAKTLQGLHYLYDNSDDLLHHASPQYRSLARRELKKLIVALETGQPHPLLGEWALEHSLNKV